MPEQYTKFYDSPVGEIEISGTNSAVNSILFVETQKHLSPKKSETVENSEAIAQCISQLDEYFEGNRTHFDFPYNQIGTAFQLKVWRALEDIPYGKTISYLELSRRIGNEKAIRAVGTTNGMNQLTIVVPCHRVIGSNGTLVGYGGDLWRKKWLLNHEAKGKSGEQMELF